MRRVLCSIPGFWSLFCIIRCTSSISLLATSGTVIVVETKNGLKMQFASLPTSQHSRVNVSYYVYTSATRNSRTENYAASSSHAFYRLQNGTGPPDAGGPLFAFRVKRTISRVIKAWFSKAKIDLSHKLARTWPASLLYFKRVSEAYKNDWKEKFPKWLMKKMDAQRCFLINFQRNFRRGSQRL